jgi:uncharacterized protein YjbJ (UPF0337 family)
MGINKDQVKGRGTETRGKLEEAVGNAVGDKDLEARGNIQKNIGAVLAKMGDGKEQNKKVVKKT